MQFKGHIMITLTRMNMIAIRPSLLKYPLNANRSTSKLWAKLGFKCPKLQQFNYHQQNKLTWSNIFELEVNGVTKIQIN